MASTVNKYSVDNPNEFIHYYYYLCEACFPISQSVERVSELALELYYVDGREINNLAQTMVPFL